jgi:hypothetical protein
MAFLHSIATAFAFLGTSRYPNCVGNLGASATLDMCSFWRAGEKGAIMQSHDTNDDRLGLGHCGHARH